jgi:hypothetical protein
MTKPNVKAELETMDRTRLVIDLGVITDPDQLNERELRYAVKDWLLCDHYLIRTRRGYRFVDPISDFDCVDYDEVPLKTAAD